MLLAHRQHCTFEVIDAQMAVNAGREVAVETSGPFDMVKGGPRLGLRRRKWSDFQKIQSESSIQL